MWLDYYLKFNDESQFLEMVPQDLRYPDSDVHSTVVIGGIYRADVQAISPGYHVNMRLRASEQIPAQLQPFILPTPNLPKHRFA